MTVLGKEFFERPALIVAKELIGCVLARKIGTTVYRHAITETEAYTGPLDRASHAYNNRRTARTEVMFGTAGKIYVYIIYGIHYMLNIVTDKSEFPSAVLIRGVKDCNGPGNVTKLFHIDKSFNNLPLGIENGLWIEQPKSRSNISIIRTPRIGISYAGIKWAAKKYRFVDSSIGKRYIFPSSLKKPL